MQNVIQEPIAALGEARMSRLQRLDEICGYVFFALVFGIGVLAPLTLVIYKLFI